MNTLSEELNVAGKKVDEMMNLAIGYGGEPRSLYNAANHLIKAGGKRLRPFLVLKSCEIVGGNILDAVPVAAAIELLHTFTLIHDDIMDKDLKRRGMRTVHGIWGSPTAIIAGDLLFAKVYNTVLHQMDLKHVPLQRVFRVLDVITNTNVDICEGQVLDMLFEKSKSATENDYYNMIGKKTAALLGASAESGAILGEGSEDSILRLKRFAYYSGIAFQIVDDVLGLTADEKVLGKPIGSDLREGKRTLIIIHALKHADRHQEKKILSALGNKKISAEETRNVVDLLNLLGSIKYATDNAQRYLDMSNSQLDNFPDSPTKKLLLELSNFMVHREY